MTVAEFIARACRPGRTNAWNLAERYCQITGVRPLANTIRSVIGELADLGHLSSGSDFDRLAWLQVADVPGVIANYLAQHEQDGDRFDYADSIAAEILNWSGLKFPVWEVRQHLRSIVPITTNHNGGKIRAFRAKP
jgi:hypothetical protein